MKKYLLGFFAIAFAVVFSAFGLNETASVTFKFVPPGGTDFSQAAVQDEANWVTGSLTTTCSGSVKACDIDLDDSYLTHPGTTLKARTNSLVSVIAPSGSTVPVTDVKKNLISIYDDIRNRP